jgi:tRNA-uridine 2-sulfurtransferase
LKKHEIAVNALNWLGHAPLGETPQPVYAKIRSARPPVEAEVTARNAGAVVTLPSGEYGVSPGQACVFYDGAGSGARVLGGGFITA